MSDRESADLANWLKAIIDAVLDGIMTIDSRGAIRSFNPAAERIFDYAAQEVIGKNVSLLMPEPDRSRHDDYVAHYLTSGERRIIGIGREVEGVRKDGSRFPLELAVGEMRIGEERWFTGITRDISDRKRAELDRDRFFALGLDLFCLADFTGHFRRVNPAFSQVLGWTADELRARPFLDFVHPDDRAATLAEMDTLAGGVATVRFSNRYQCKDGSWRWLSWNAQPQPAEGVIYATARDITDLRKAEDALRSLTTNLDALVAERTAQLQTSEQRFHNLFEFAPDALVKTNAQGIITLVNRQAEEIFGWARAELVGQPVEMLMPQRERQDHPALRERYLQAAVPRPMGGGATNLRALRKDSSEFPVEISLSPIDTEDGRAVVAAVRDVTAQRQMEETVRQSETRYRQLVEGASEVFYKVTTAGDPLKGRLDFVSQKARDITGRQPEEFLRDPELWLKLVHPDDLPAIADSTRAALSELKRVTRVYRIQNADGKYRTIEDEVTPVADGHGGAIGYTGVARDITEHRLLEAQLRQSQRMESIGRLAGGIAHDFNNLLTVILGTVELALENRTEEDPLYADLREVRLAGERAAGLTRQLLAFSRRQILQPKVVSLNTVLADMLSMLQRLLGEDIAVRFLPGTDLGSVEADPGQIEQVVVNLAVNARDAMPTGGTLTIETQDVALDEAYAAEHPSVQPGPHVMLAVSDTGIGMDETTRRQIFEPFFTTKAPGKGTGLGLSTVYGIVKQSGGSVWVYSEVGRGSTFKIYLPRAEGTTHVDRHVWAVAAPRGSETILVVEDEEGVRRLAKRCLESAGYAVLAAANGEEALRLLDRNRALVSLVLTDVIMPGLSARDLARRISESSPEVKIIFTSGYTDDAIVHHGVLDEGTHYVSKPYTAAELTRKVREVLDA